MMEEDKSGSAEQSAGLRSPTSSEGEGSKPPRIRPQPPPPRDSRPGEGRPVSLMGVVPRPPSARSPHASAAATATATAGPVGISRVRTQSSLLSRRPVVVSSATFLNVLCGDNDSAAMDMLSRDATSLQTFIEQTGKYLDDYAPSASGSGRPSEAVYRLLYPEEDSDQQVLIKQLAGGRVGSLERLLTLITHSSLLSLRALSAASATAADTYRQALEDLRAPISEASIVAPFVAALKLASSSSSSSTSATSSSSSSLPPVNSRTLSVPKEDWTLLVSRVEDMYDNVRRLDAEVGTGSFASSSSSSSSSFSSASPSNTLPVSQWFNDRAGVPPVALLRTLEQLALTVDEVRETAAKALDDNDDNDDDEEDEDEESNGIGGRYALRNGRGGASRNMREMKMTIEALQRELAEVRSSSSSSSSLSSSSSYEQTIADLKSKLDKSSQAVHNLERSLYDAQTSQSLALETASQRERALARELEKARSALDEEKRHRDGLHEAHFKELHRVEHAFAAERSKAKVELDVAKERLMVSEKSRLEAEIRIIQFETMLKSSSSFAEDDSSVSTSSSSSSSTQPIRGVYKTVEGLVKELSLAASRLSIAATSGTSASMSTSTSTSTSTSAAGTGAGAGSLPSASDMTRLVESLRQVLERADDMDRSILERKAATADELEATVASLKRGLASAEESLAAERAELSALSTRLHEKLSGTVDQFTKLLPRSGKLDMVAPSALESMEESFKTAFEKEMEVMSRAYRMQIIKLQQEKAKLELELQKQTRAAADHKANKT